MASIEKSTMTIPKVVVLLFAVCQTMLTLLASYLGNQASNDARYEKLSARVDLVSQEFRNMDVILDLKISQNTKGLDAVSSYISAGMRPEEPEIKPSWKRK